MGVLTAVFNTLIIVASIFLICLILIQRGKGGGLAGAFGGVGGSSAFGTKAGDTFTRVTVVTAAIWILMAMVLVVLTNRKTTLSFGPETSASSTKDAGSKSKSKSTGSSTAEAPAGADAGGGGVPAIPPQSSFPAVPGDVPASK